MLFQRPKKTPDNEQEDFPLEVSEEAKRERHYLWMARVFGLISVAALMANIILFIAVSSLVPIMRVQPFYVATQNKDQQIVDIRRPSIETLSMQELQDSFVRQYLLARYGVGSDISELKRRWGIGGLVQWMSSNAVFEAFSREEAAWGVEEAEKSGMTRDVRVLRTYPEEMSAQNGTTSAVWHASLELTTMKVDTPEPVREVINVTMVLQFGGKNAENITWEERLKNPLGVVVNRYGISRDRSAKKEDAKI